MGKYSKLKEKILVWPVAPMPISTSPPYVNCWSVSVLSNGLRAATIFSLGME